MKSDTQKPKKAGGFYEHFQLRIGRSGACGAVGGHWPY